MPVIDAKNKIALRTLRELTLLNPIQPGRAASISAASGLVRCGDYFYVVADDELQLGIFSALAPQPGITLPLLAGQLPLPAAARKRAKPDFEVLLELPPAAARPAGALLALGSGSSPQRHLGVLLTLTAHGQLHHTPPLIIDFSALYAALEREFGAVNIEGGVVQRQQLLLLQRGNTAQAINAIVQLDLATLLQELATQEIALLPIQPEKNLVANVAQLFIGPAAIRSITRYDLGSLDGVALGFTDATCLPDQQLLALAAAEDTSDAYADGATTGSCICRFDKHNRLIDTLPMTAPAKLEGITVWQRGANTDTVLAFVTDGDDAGKPALLLSAHLAAIR